MSGDKLKNPEVNLTDLSSLGLPERFVVEEELGSGGMSVVYAAHHRQTGQRLAIKFMRAHLAVDPRHVKRFEQEASAIAKLSHPNIIRLIDYGVTESGAPFMVMERADGPTLKDVLRQEKPLTSERFHSVFYQVCDALQFAHSKNIVHRDIKPSNIVVNGNLVQVLDFGVARMLDDDKESTLTGTGEVVGSPQYMSPEQALAQKIDTRSDIFSVGCVMYEALTGNMPFSSTNSVQAIVERLVNTAEPIDKRFPEGKFPPALVDIVQRCLQKERDDRYQTIDELKRDLQQAQNSVGEFRTTYRKRPSRAIRGLISAGGIGVLMLGAAAYMFWDSEREHPLPSYMVTANKACKLNSKREFSKAADLWEQAAVDAAAKKANGDEVAKIWGEAAGARVASENHDKAASDLERAGDASATDESKASWYTEAANEYYVLKDYRQARHDFQQALNLRLKNVTPNDADRVAELWANFGTASLEAGDTAAALNALEKAVDLEPDRNSMGAANDYRWYGRALTTSGNKKEALKYLEMARVIYEREGDKRHLANIDEWEKKANALAN